MTAAPFSPFDNRGHLRNDISETEIAALSMEKKALLSAVLEAAKQEGEAEEIAREAQAHLHEAVANRERAMQAHNKANPPQSPIEALRAVQRAQRGF